MPRLISCENCARHVFATESACPFCQAAITVAPVAMPRVARGLSRAQRLALTAALVAPIAGCADESAEDDAAETDSAAEELVAVPLYGVPVAGSSSLGGRGGAGGKGGRGGVGGKGGKGGVAGTIAVPLYGLPVAADDTVVSAEEDAVEEDAGVPTEVEVEGAEQSLTIQLPKWPTIPILLYGAPPSYDDVNNLNDLIEKN
jgi:hypothetical protein